MRKVKLITESSYDIEISEGKKSDSFFITGIFSSAERRNNNNRIYSHDILKREVDKVSEKVKNRCLWGELSHPNCIYGDNDILTSDGWKPIKDIDNDEVVATLNPITRNIEYHKIDEKVEEYYEGDMINFKNRQMDMDFTPNHRFAMINRYDKLFYDYAENIEKKETRKYDKSYIPKTGNWKNGNESDSIVLEGKPHVKHSKYDYLEDVKIDMSVFCSFMGLYLAEGCVSKDNNNRILIYQNEGKSCDMIRELLSKFPKEMEWQETKKNEKMVVFSLSDQRLSELLKPLGTCYTKYVPEPLKQLDSQYLYEILYWFGIGDGRGFIEDDIRKDIFSVSEKLIDDFHEIAFKCGISARKTVEICDVDYKFADRIIKAENKKPLHFLKIYTTKGIYLDRRFMKTSRKPYKGMVYCVKVKNENFYVRNNNSVSFWTGNSAEVNPDRIAVLTQQLEWRGNDLYGKAKVLETPMGKILKTLVKEGKMGISSRGLGTVDENTNYVNEDYNLITWDVVVDPSNQPSWVNGIYEGKEFVIYDKKDEKELTEEDIKKAQEEYFRYLMEEIENLTKGL